MSKVRHQYFNWLSNIVNLQGYDILLSKLFDTEFVWSIPFDAHRADDGIDLRYRFGNECGIPDPVICTEIDNRACSILEMIVALSLRAEEQIMRDDNRGDRTSLWIFYMFESLGLLYYQDTRYDPFAVDDIIDVFLDHQYTRTGKNGLFEIPDLEPGKDMRTVEIWTQMCWFMNYYIGGHRS